MKSWYAAKLLFEAHIGELRDPHALREESIRVLLCEDEDTARSRAEEAGREAEHDYSNEQGETVSWKFISVLEIQDLCEAELADGTEVFSTLIRG